MRFSAEQFEEFNRIAAREDDRLFAVRLRAYRPNLTNHLDNRALVDEVTTARASAVAIGLGNTGLRARFVMIHVLLTPYFWSESEAHAMLYAATGTPDIRFGDVCALIRLAAAEAGCSEEIWW